MKIAILASNRKPIPSPPDSIFAPGVMIEELTEGLMKEGHDVTLFAPEGTKTSAKLITAGTRSSYEEFSGGKDFAQKRAANPASYARQDVQYELLMCATAFEYIQKNNFDIVHSHKTLHEIYFTNFVDIPCLFTFHDSPSRENQNICDTRRLKKYAKSAYFVSVSDAQREGLGFLNFVGTVHNSVKADSYQLSRGGEEMVFVGRLDRQKGVEMAVRVAKKLGIPLKIAGDIVQDKEGFEIYKSIKPFIDDKNIKYLGHVHYNKMHLVYQKSKILLFPITKPEGCGLTPLESMACGTPVIAFDQGFVREVIKDGETGFICPAGDLESMVKAVNKIYNMPDEQYQKMRMACRKHVEENFTIEEMVNKYERVYQKVIEDYRKRKNENRSNRANMA